MRGPAAPSSAARGARPGARDVTLLTALALTLAGCAGQLDMSEGQLDRALHRMTLQECHARARAAVGDRAREEVERASITYDCMRRYEQ